jgi:signal transduction histidine kinase
MTRVRASHWVTAALAVAITTAVGAAVLFARADQAERIAADASGLGTLHQIVAEAAAYRAGLVVVFAAAGIGDTATVDETAPELHSTSRRIEMLVAAAPVGGPDLTVDASTLVTVTARMIGDLAEGRVEAARAMASTDLIPAVGSISAVAQQQAGLAAGRINAERSEAGRAARSASFMVALLVPALAVAAIRRASRRRVERERLMAEIARQREVAEVKDRLIAGISHELRTPITGIYGFADLMVSHPEPALMAESSLEILQEAGKLRRMVDDILVTSRLDAGNLEFRPAATSIVETIDRSVAEHRRLGRDLKVDCEEATVEVDPGRLEHAVRNLVANAFTHGREPVMVLGRVAGPSYRLAVCDSGAGPDPAIDPFRRFAHQVEDITVTGSLGLGLSVAKALTEAMGGKIGWTRDRGLTVFAVTLPLSPP